MAQLLGLSDEQITKLIKETGNPERYLLEGQSLDDENIKFNFNILNLIKKTGNIEKYLNPYIAKKLNLNNSQINILASESEDINKYLLKGQKVDDPYLQIGILNLIKATGKIEEYLTPEIVKYFNLNIFEISKLINELEDKTKYLLENQNIGDKNLTFSMANIIFATRRVRKIFNTRIY